jgi:hypothetical protein
MSPAEAETKAKKCQPRSCKGVVLILIVGLVANKDNGDTISIVVFLLGVWRAQSGRGR